MRPQRERREKKARRSSQAANGPGRGRQEPPEPSGGGFDPAAPEQMEDNSHETGDADPAAWNLTCSFRQVDDRIIA